jgi:hypothetical protein
MAGTSYKVQAAVKGYLWLSWVTAVWALASYALVHAHLHLPPFVELLTRLARGFALFGGCIAVLYVLLGARTTLLVASGIVAAAINFWYCWEYLRALF